MVEPSVLHLEIHAPAPVSVDLATMMALIEKAYDEFTTDAREADVLAIAKVESGSLLIDFVSLVAATSEIYSKRDLVAAFYSSLHSSYQAAVGLLDGRLSLTRARLFGALASAVQWRGVREVALRCNTSNDVIVVDQDIALLLVKSRLHPTEIETLASRLSVVADKIRRREGIRVEETVTVLDGHAYLGRPGGELIRIAYTPGAHRIKNSGRYDLTLYGHSGGIRVRKHRFLGIQ